MYNLFKDSGTAVISVPLSSLNVNEEFYKDLKSFHLTNSQGKYKLEWVDSVGQKYVDLEPEMHGGSGQTISFRRFGEKELIDNALSAGFSEVKRLDFSYTLGVQDLEMSGVYMLKKFSQRL